MALRRAHPDLVLLVDDVDSLDDAPVVPVVREIMGLVDRDRGLVAMTTSPAAVLGRFRGLDVEMARHRTGLLLSPRPADGDVLGLRRLDGIPSWPGRGLACTPGEVTELQVFLADPDVGVGPRGQDVTSAPDSTASWSRPATAARAAPSATMTRVHPTRAWVPLDQADADGQQQHIPDDRRRPRPGPPAEPAESDESQGDPDEKDEERRHEDPCGIAPLTDRQLVDEVHGEPHEGERLESGQHGGDEAGPT